MKVLIVGDSQAAGPAGRHLEEQLTAAGHLVRRIGYVGHGAYDWTRMHWDEYQGALRSMRPDSVVMIFGGNDPPNENLRRAMQTFKASAPKVFYAGPPRYDRRPEVMAVTDGIRPMARQVFGSRHLDAYPFTGPDVPRARDGLHFTTSGGRVWGEGILREWQRGLRGFAGAPSRLALGLGLAGLGAVILSAAYWYSSPS